jgi:hypothetical protein
MCPFFFVTRHQHVEDAVLVGLCLGAEQNTKRRDASFFVVWWQQFNQRAAPNVQPLPSAECTSSRVLTPNR